MGNKPSVIESYQDYIKKLETNLLHLSEENKRISTELEAAKSKLSRYGRIISAKLPSLEVIPSSISKGNATDLQWNCMTDNDYIFKAWVDSIGVIREYKIDSTGEIYRIGIALTSEKLSDKKDEKPLPISSDEKMVLSDIESTVENPKKSNEKKPRMFFQEAEFQVVSTPTSKHLGPILNVRVLHSKYPELLRQGVEIFHQLKKSTGTNKDFLISMFHIPWDQPNYICFRVRNTRNFKGLPPPSPTFHLGSITLELQSVFETYNTEGLTFISAPIDFALSVR